MKTKTLKQTVVFDTTPMVLYEMLMDSTLHSQITGSEARISRDEGGDFSVWGGDIRGKNLELVSGKRIVQSWYCNTDGWPKDHFSRVTFTFRKKGDQTILELVQSDVPVSSYDSIAAGWNDYYWQPMRNMINNTKR